MTGLHNRRTFLRTAGVSLALPWMESLGAKGGEPSPPKRMVFICSALGLHGPALYPTKTGTDYESTEYLELLKDHRDDFTLFSGLSHPDQGGSEHATLMTWLSAARNPGRDGFRNSISVDQFAAEKLGSITRFPSVILSSEGPSSQSYTSSGVMIPAESSPSRMFAKMFLQGNPGEVARQKRKLSEGRSILDALMAQSKSLSRHASTADRERLDEYFESVRRTEVELQEARAWLDKPKPEVVQKPPVDIGDKSDLVGRVRLLLNLVPLIVQSDSSRIVSIVIQDHLVVPQVAGVSSEHHNLSHHGKDPAKIAQLKKIERELLGCFRDLLERMGGKKEGPDSLLDNTMTLFGSNLGNANAHDPRNLPILLAGGGFNHGQHLARDRKDNTPLSNLFLRMLGAMKIETESFATSSGELEW
ncbi:MAG: DUF1552 domain-containing protein [Akkermansiaceae bacterium]|jgi:hypothetical protein